MFDDIEEIKHMNNISSVADNIEKRILAYG
jgi:hypothetical protein